MTYTFSLARENDGLRQVNEADCRPASVCARRGFLICIYSFFPIYWMILSSLEVARKLFPDLIPWFSGRR